jgi:transcriptional regulator with XRE-family HTH domain
VKYNSELLVQFGQHICNLRKKQNLSQEGLAHKSNLHRTHIGMIERAERNITLINIEKLSNGLGVNIDELFRF